MIICSFVAAVVGAGAFAFAAAGGDGTRAVGVERANANTAQAGSVHYSVAVTLTHEHVPQTLHIDGAATRAVKKLSARLQLGLVTGHVMRSESFLYETAPAVVQVFGHSDWVRLTLDGFGDRSPVMSTLRELTPAPILHVVGEAQLRPVGKHGVFAGPVAYDDPIVRASLRDLNAGIEFRGMRVRVVVGRDGLVHRVRLTGKTVDGKTTLDLRARLFGFGKPVTVTPPKPGTFMDPHLMDVKS